ncbi:ABC transporter permease [Solibacillus sp. R5-41]|uniref:ABC transporter permease n=1 Tax=Solibacillus sp. R5-41 TaxID=2048654 RepID=UPI000C124F10|nr:ABC transporter permease subunit [Solibacillus sp. R5-41]ATP41877.1 ABC transporter permease [Solibacillus sp. R5-41]
MKLVVNEWVKLWSKKSTWVMLILMLLLVIVPAGAMKYYDESNAENWQQNSQQVINDFEKIIEEEDLDESTGSYYYETIMIEKYRLEHNIAPNGTTMDTFMRSSLEVVSMVITIFIVTVAAGIVSSEFSTGTIKMLLTRPVARWKILLSKLVTTIIFGLTLYLSAIILSAILGATLWGTAMSTPLEIVNGEVVQTEVWSSYFEIFLLSFGSFFMSIFFAFLIGTIFKSSSLAIGLTLFISFMSNMVVFLLSRYEFIKYVWITHVNLSQYATGATPMIPDTTLSLALTVNFVYAVIFLAITFIVFNKRDVTA